MSITTGFYTILLIIYSARAHDPQDNNINKLDESTSFVNALLQKLDGNLPFKFSIDQNFRNLSSYSNSVSQGIITYSWDELNLSLPITIQNSVENIRGFKKKNEWQLSLNVDELDPEGKTINELHSIIGFTNYTKYTNGTTVFSRARLGTIISLQIDIDYAKEYPLEATISISGQWTYCSLKTPTDNSTDSICLKQTGKNETIRVEGDSLRFRINLRNGENLVKGEGISYAKGSMGLMLPNKFTNTVTGKTYNFSNLVKQNGVSSNDHSIEYFHKTGPIKYVFQAKAASNVDSTVVKSIRRERVSVPDAEIDVKAFGGRTYIFKPNSLWDMKERQKKSNTTLRTLVSDYSYDVNNIYDPILFQLLSIKELNNKEELVRSGTIFKREVNLTNLNYDIQIFPNTTFGTSNIPCKKVSLTALNIGGLDTNIIVNFYLMTGFNWVDLGQEIVWVWPGCLLFETEVSDWPFCQKSANPVNTCNDKGIEYLGEFLQLEYKIEGSRIIYLGNQVLRKNYTSFDWYPAKSSVSGNIYKTNIPKFERNIKVFFRGSIVLYHLWPVTVAIIVIVCVAAIVFIGIGIAIWCCYRRKKLQDAEKQLNNYV